ncbi:MAG: glycosyltransferase [Acidobacteria bacterium]|nr:glycosyltransferase [Acidobacteriota bacterium]MCA1641313.1 glycosyltransferase [Acidobacteriota bacterium]
MEATPLISIIVPTRGRHAQLAACLASLAAQDFPRDGFEVIVVDDGSVPPVGDRVAPFRGRLDLKLLAQPNAGPAAARNRGAAQARGPFLAFTDDDCLPDAGWLAALAARFRASPADLVGGRTVNALADNPYSATSQLIIDVVYDHYNAGGGGASFFASNNFAAPAEAFRAAGGFDVNFRCSEDRDFCDRWRGGGRRLVYAPEAVVRHAHALGALSLWRQHFGYGRGAYSFHRKREARGARRFKPESAFYSKLLRAALAQQRPAQSIRMTALLAWAQLANAAGFFYECLRPAARAD